jgi:hypothetical protein
MDDPLPSDLDAFAQNYNMAGAVPPPPATPSKGNSFDFGSIVVQSAEDFARYPRELAGDARMAAGLLARGVDRQPAFRREQGLAVLRVLEGQFDGLLVFDNGSGAETKQWLAEQPDMLAFDAKGAGIHDMWNAGVEYAVRTSGGLCNVVFLNNDLKIGPDFIEGLVKAMRGGPWVAVSPNYDGRPSNGTPVERVQGICAERYDGTGGLAGFAFAVRGELFAQGYRFPMDAKWWFGDNDFTLTCDSSNLTYGIAIDTTVEHLGAGTAGDWQAKKWSKQLAADREAFLAKWQPMGVTL